MQRFRGTVGLLVVVGVAIGIATSGVWANPPVSVVARVGQGCTPAPTLTGVAVALRGAGGTRLSAKLFGSEPNGAVLIGPPTAALCETVRVNANVLAGLAANGIRTLVVRRRSPPTSAKLELGDVRAAIGALQRRGAHRIAVIGEAAGGVLALGAAPAARGSLTAVVALSGPNGSGADASKHDAVTRSQLLPVALRAAGTLHAPLLLVADEGNAAAVSSARKLLAIAPGLDNQLALVPGAGQSSLLDPRRGTPATSLAKRIVGFVAESTHLPTGTTRGTAISRLGPSFRTASGYNRYSYVVVGIGDAEAAGELRARSLVYMSGTSVQPRFFTGVTVDEARRHDWLLKDAAGNYVMNANYGAFIGDLGNPSYQARWADNVTRFLRENHNDGAFIDDVIADAPSLTGGAYPAKYPNRAAWEDAQVAFITTVGAKLKARGFYVVAESVGYVVGDPRSNSGELTARFWERLAPGLNGLWSEYWLELPTDITALRAAGTDDWTQFWSGWQGLISVAQNAGVDFFAEMYGSGANVAVMRYGKASFLLDWDGRGGGFAYTPENGTADPWNKEWTLNIGRPAGAKYQVGVGWRREYTNGTTLVNPSLTTPQVYALGSTYFQPDGTPTSTVTLAPTTALTLRRVQP